MNGQTKTKVITIRVDPEYQAHLRQSAAEFGWSISEAMLIAANAHFQFAYETRVKGNRGWEEIREDVVEGSEHWQYIAEQIEKCKRNQEYFHSAQEALSSELYQEIGGLEAYRAFLRETVDTEA
jgi:hypothetical protein